MKVAKSLEILESDFISSIAFNKEEKECINLYSSQAIYV